MRGRAPQTVPWSAFHPRAMFHRRCLAPLAVLSLVTLPACQTETTIKNYRPMLAGLPNAETGMPVAAAPPGAETDPTKLPGDTLVVEQPDGTKKLLARTGRHVMVHIANTLDADDADLFLKEVLSERAKGEYYARGRDPREAFETLKKRRDEIRELFNRMPMGEYTPGLFLEPAGGGVQRLALSGRAAQGLAWTGIDLVMERGNYRLVWFVSPPARR